VRIPQQFDLMSQTIQVKFIPDLHLKQQALGQSLFNEGLILIQKNTKAYPMTKEQQEQTFFHELFHFILYALNEHEKNSDEKFVDMVGSLLHQFHKSKK